MFKRILLPLDGSELAKQVYPDAARLAAAFASEIDLMSVCDSMEGEAGDACRVYLDREAQQIRQLLPEYVKVNQAVTAGKPPEQILKYATANKVDIIMMTAYGSSGPKLWPLGSTVDKLVHTTDIPLIVIRPKKIAGPQDETSNIFKNVLVPLERSERSATVLPVLKQLSAKIPEKITLLNVIEEGHNVRTVGGLSYIPYIDQDIDSRKQEILLHLNGLIQEFKRTSVAEIQVNIRTGNPAEEILKYAETANSSLIVLTTHIHSTLQAWFYGSITQKIIQSPICSVMLVPYQPRPE